jgi:hypothetical protein
VRKHALILALISFVALGAWAADNARDAKVTAANATEGPAGGGAQYWLDYFNAGPAGTYLWNGLFYMSNMFKPDPAWYPFGILTVEVFPGRLDGLTTTSAAGIIDGVRVFTGAGGNASLVNVVAEQFDVAGAAQVWVPVNWATGTAPVISSGDFWAGIWNSTDVEGGLQGSTNGSWIGPPVEPFECIDFLTGTPTAQSAGPWYLHLTGNCGDQYGTTSAAAVRVLVDDTIPVELMRFSVE